MDKWIADLLSGIEVVVNLAITAIIDLARILARPAGVLDEVSKSQSTDIRPLFFVIIGLVCGPMSMIVLAYSGLFEANVGEIKQVGLALGGETSLGVVKFANLTISIVLAMLLARVMGRVANWAGGPPQRAKASTYYACGVASILVSIIVPLMAVYIISTFAGGSCGVVLGGHAWWCEWRDAAAAGGSVVAIFAPILRICSAGLQGRKLRRWLLAIPFSLACITVPLPFYWLVYTKANEAASGPKLAVSPSQLETILDGKTGVVMLTNEGTMPQLLDRASLYVTVGATPEPESPHAKCGFCGTYKVEMSEPGQLLEIPPNTSKALLVKLSPHLDWSSDREFFSAECFMFRGTYFDIRGQPNDTAQTANLRDHNQEVIVVRNGSC